MKLLSPIFIIGSIFVTIAISKAQTDIQLRDPEYLVEQYNQLVAKHNALIEKTRLIIIAQKNAPIGNIEQEGKENHH